MTQAPCNIKFMAGGSFILHGATLMYWTYKDLASTVMCFWGRALFVPMANIVPVGYVCEHVCVAMEYVNVSGMHGCM